MISFQVITKNVTYVQPFELTNKTNGMINISYFLYIRGHKFNFSSLGTQLSAPNIFKEENRYLSLFKIIFLKIIFFRISYDYNNL